MRERRQRRSLSCGFTLIEVLLAITITGFVLASATTLIVSISEIWANRQNSHFFGDHVDGVTEFLQARLSEAGTEIALDVANQGRGLTNDSPEEKEDDGPEVRVVVNALEDGIPANQASSNSQSQSQAGLIRTSGMPIDLARPPGFGSARDPLLNFRLREIPPLLVHPENTPTLGVDVFLYFKRDEGLSFLWYPLLQEEIEDERDLLRTQISEYVTDLTFIYWDERFERWEEDTEPRQDDDDDFILPRYLKLQFEHEGITVERTVTVPSTSRVALLF